MLPISTLTASSASPSAGTRAVGSSDILGPSVSPTGRYVFSSDYDHLLMMYHDLEKRLELRPDL